MGLSKCRLMVIQFDVLVGFGPFGNSHEKCRIIVTRSVRYFYFYFLLNQHFFDFNFEHVLIHINGSLD